MQIKYTFDIFGFCFTWGFAAHGSANYQWLCIV